MKVVLQVVKKASVEVNNKIVGQINKGYLLLVGIFEEDDETSVLKMADKICKLRVFKDENDKTNLSLKDVNGEVLSVSQFTLCADTSGNRPGFSKAAKPEKAIYLYELFNNRIRDNGFKVETGIFGADMGVDLVNDGPFTLVL